MYASIGFFFLIIRIIKFNLSNTYLEVDHVQDELY